MSMRRNRIGAAVATAVALACGASSAFAHHEITAKFDEAKHETIKGIVTSVDWRNPHVHVFVNVTTDAGVTNWAVELESTIALQRAAGDTTRCTRATR